MSLPVRSCSTTSRSLYAGQCSSKTSIWRYSLYDWQRLWFISLLFTFGMSGYDVWFATAHEFCSHIQILLSFRPNFVLKLYKFRDFCTFYQLRLMIPFSYFFLQTSFGHQARACEIKDVPQPWRDSWYLSHATRGPFELHSFDPHTHTACSRFAERYIPYIRGTKSPSTCLITL